jgi:serine/threonine-protein kinase RsbW
MGLEVPDCRPGRRLPELLAFGKCAFIQMAISGTLTIDNEPFEVSRAAEWLDGLIAAAGYGPRVLAVLQVAMEELLSNILIHAYADLESHTIEINVIAEPSVAILEIFDDGVPFDPTQHERPATENTEDPPPGGLGLPLVGQTMDEMVYERIAGRNHVTLRKFITH